MRQTDDGLCGVFHLALPDAQSVAAVGFFHVYRAVFHRDDVDGSVVLPDFIGIRHSQRAAEHFFPVYRHHDGRSRFAPAIWDTPKSASAASRTAAMMMMSFFFMFCLSVFGIIGGFFLCRRLAQVAQANRFAALQAAQGHGAPAHADHAVCARRRIRFAAHGDFIPASAEIAFFSGNAAAPVFAEDVFRAARVLPAADDLIDVGFQPLFRRLVILDAPQNRQRVERSCPAPSIPVRA